MEVYESRMRAKSAMNAIKKVIVIFMHKRKGKFYVNLLNNHRQGFKSYKIYRI